MRYTDGEKGKRRVSRKAKGKDERKGRTEGKARRRRDGEIRRLGRRRHMAETGREGSEKKRRRKET